MTSNKAKKSSRQDKHPSQDQEYDNLIDHGVGLLSRFQRFSLDFLGVFLLAAALLTLLALTLPELTGGTLVTLWREFIFAKPSAMVPSWLWLQVLWLGCWYYKRVPTR